MKQFDPRDWYWQVADDPTRVFGSARGDYVNRSNPAFVAWSSDGTQPTHITSEQSLGEQLAPTRVRPVAAGVLDSYLDKQAGDIFDLALAKWMLNLENRQRATERALGLNDNPQNVSPAQARAALKVIL